MVWLLDDDDPRFPPARLAAPDSSGLLAVGGDYSVPRLVEAYANGIFPWSVHRGRISWHSPDPRFVLLRENWRVPKSLRRVLKAHPFEITVDRDFPAVIRACAAAVRPPADGDSWINPALRRGVPVPRRLPCPPRRRPPRPLPPRLGIARPLDGTLTIVPRRVPYDVKTAARKIVDAGLPRMLARRLKSGT